jgi:hypothetical protein
MKANGQFVIYTESAKVFLTLGPVSPGAVLILGSNGNMVIGNGQDIFWATNVLRDC